MTQSISTQSTCPPALSQLPLSALHSPPTQTRPQNLTCFLYVLLVLLLIVPAAQAPAPDRLAALAAATTLAWSGGSDHGLTLLPSLGGAVRAAGGAQLVGHAGAKAGAAWVVLVKRYVEGLYRIRSPQIMPNPAPPSLLIVLLLCRSSRSQLSTVLRVPENALRAATAYKQGAVPKRVLLDHFRDYAMQCV